MLFFLLLLFSKVALIICVPLVVPVCLLLCSFCDIRLCDGCVCVCGGGGGEVFTLIHTLSNV